MWGGGMNAVLKRTILIIDDDPHLQAIFRIVLERAGYQVISRMDATTGLMWLEQILPDLVLLDIMLPGVSGSEMLHQIRQTENGRQVPVIIATASADLNKEDFSAYNISNLIHKPILPSDLAKVVNDFFDSLSGGTEQG